MRTIFFERLFGRAQKIGVFGQLQPKTCPKERKKQNSKTTNETNHETQSEARVKWLVESVEYFSGLRVCVPLSEFKVVSKPLKKLTCSHHKRFSEQTRKRTTD
jgi:hypothetical protein